VTGVAPPFARVNDAFAALLRLREDAARLGAPESERIAWLSKTQRAVLETGTALVEARFSILNARLRFHFNVAATQATRFGDARMIVDQYCRLVYGVDLDYIWPRLQLLLEDSAQAKTLEAAQAQNEFAVLALALSVSVPLVWLPLIGLYGASFALLAAIAVAAPISWMFFYQLVVESQAAFGSVVRALVDRRHLDLLVAMNQERPQTIAEERDLWGRLQSGAEGGVPSLRYAASAAHP
jgi:hypothetical protein